MNNRFSPQKTGGASASSSSKKASEKSVTKTKKTKQTKSASTSAKAPMSKTDATWSRIHTLYIHKKHKNIIHLGILLFLSLVVVGIILVSLLPLLWSVDVNVS